MLLVPPRGFGQVRCVLSPKTTTNFRAQAPARKAGGIEGSRSEDSLDRSDCWVQNRAGTRGGRRRHEKDDRLALASAEPPAVGPARTACRTAPTVATAFKILNMHRRNDSFVPVTQESQARTRAFARVIGPWLVIVPGIIALRAPGMGAFASEFFKSGLFVWFAGALLLFGGLLIIAFHQYWSNVAAVLISVFGWILALRGLLLMAAPKLYERAAGDERRQVYIKPTGWSTTLRRTCGRPTSDTARGSRRLLAGLIDDNPGVRIGATSSWDRRHRGTRSLAPLRSLKKGFAHQGQAHSAATYPSESNGRRRVPMTRANPGSLACSRSTRS